MKKNIIQIAVWLIPAVFTITFAYSQSVTLKFTGRDASNHHVQLNSVIIKNKTRNWQEIVYWPDTTLFLYTVGIDDLTKEKGFFLMQNTPNPFNGITEVSLFTEEGGETFFSIYDFNGSLVVSNRQQLEKGFHRFSVQLAAAQNYLLTANCNGHLSCIKMVNKGSGNNNDIKYLGIINNFSFDKWGTNNPFIVGDNMEYIGYAYINGTLQESNSIINQADGMSQTFTLHFSTSQTTLPTVATNNVSIITSTTATCGGNVSSDGGSTVIARGVCWSTSSNPTISNNHTSDGYGIGTFISTISGLSSGTTYYVRAYATNSTGTAYGNIVSFATSEPQDGLPCPNTSMVTDYDGNTYNTVQIGNQCWMKENLRTRHFEDGTLIFMGSNDQSFASTTISYCFCPNNSSNYVSQCGYLYNWAAVMHGSSSSNSNPSGIQGVCPNGWHVPSDVEWTQLTNYVSNQSNYICNSNSPNIAKALATSTWWNSCAETCTVGNNLSSNNTTGFGAIPTGNYNSYTIWGFGNFCEYWSSTEDNYLTSWCRQLSYDSSEILRYGDYKTRGLSVRCLKN